MFCSLDRIDIVTDSGNQKVAVQTEHRDHDELENERELSIIMTATRALAPRQNPEIASVLFKCQHQVPDWFAELVLACGADLSFVDDEQSDPGNENPDRRDELVSEAFDSLAKKVFARFGVGAEQTAVSLIEDHLLAAVSESGGKEDDEYTYWKSVIELGAVTGSCIRAVHGGTWSSTLRTDADEGDVGLASIVPYAFSIDQIQINVFDKAARYFEQGETQACSRLFRAIADALPGSEEGMLFPLLKPSDWETHDQKIFGTTLFQDDSESSHSKPKLTLVRDMPSTIQYLPADTPQDELGKLFTEALLNLASVEVDIERLPVDDVHVLIVSGDHYFISEKVLDQAFMQSIHDRLNADRVLASVPTRGILLATSADAPKDAGLLAGFTQQAYNDGAPQERITPGVFVLEDGRLVGFDIPDLDSGN